MVYLASVAVVAQYRCWLACVYFYDSLYYGFDVGCSSSLDLAEHVCFAWLNQLSKVTLLQLVHYVLCYVPWVT